MRHLNTNVWEHRGIEVVQHGPEDFRYTLSEGIEGDSENLLDAENDIDAELAQRAEDAGNAEPELDESMDGDHASALASAGFGTDEDYGDFGGGCED